LGHAVPVPSAVTVNIVFNSTFQPSVTNGDTAPLVDPTHATNTLWLGRSHELRADNLTGRVFLEMLGAKNGDGTIPFLGFEILDVFSDPVPVDINVELGTRIPAYQDNRDDSQLTIAPFQTQAQFYYRQAIPNSPNITLYAVHETSNLNDFESYWLT